MTKIRVSGVSGLEVFGSWVDDLTFRKSRYIKVGFCCCPSKKSVFFGQH